MAEGAKVALYVCNVYDFASHNQMDLCEHVNTHSFASEFEKLMSVSRGYVEESTAVEENYVESFCPSPCSSNKMESSFSNDLSKKSQVDGNTDKKTWNTENTLLLIDLYNRHDEEFQRSVKKYVWQKIANILNKEKGLSITPQQCDTKWKCLTTTYKQTLKHNSTSGNDRKHWEYFDRIHDILHKKPEINAEATCSTRRGLVTKPNDNTTVNDKPSMSTPSSTNNDLANCPLPGQTRLHPDSAAD